jgi:hypothetical protein
MTRPEPLTPLVKTIQKIQSHPSSTMYTLIINISRKVKKKVLPSNHSIFLDALKITQRKLDKIKPTENFITKNQVAFYFFFQFYWISCPSSAFYYVTPIKKNDTCMPYIFYYFAYTVKHYPKFSACHIAVMFFVVELFTQ